MSAEIKPVVTMEEIFDRLDIRVGRISAEPSRSGLISSVFRLFSTEDGSFSVVLGFLLGKSNSFLSENGLFSLVFSYFLRIFSLFLRISSLFLNIFSPKTWDFSDLPPENWKVKY